MTIYAIGDVQGCFDALQQLLDRISFHPEKDTLWFTGDLVNRGPNSLSVLRFIKSLGQAHQTVLGNHDLHLLAVALGAAEANSDDTFNDILTAADKEELLHWLAHRPMLYHDEETDFIMTHAGLAPSWDLKEAKELAKEVETLLQSDKITYFLAHLYGDEPSHWNPHLSGIDRLRCITNYLTRMRFCDKTGQLNFTYKGEIQNKPLDLIPWFEVKTRVNSELNIIFGHWAALNGKVNLPHLYPLDTGCVWGGCLTAMRLADKQYFSVKCVK
jgi:bis(5'-nucleosyl)-tetraphosphatase (symmetrical)